MNFTINYDEIQGYNETVIFDFPKYTTQIMNLANSNSGGTRKGVVGQVSDMFPEFKEATPTEQRTIEYWKRFYQKKREAEGSPNSLEDATDKVYDMLNKLREAIALINRDMVRNWVEDLVINKTFNGLYVQGVVLKVLAEKKGIPGDWRLATPDEESQGIDGYVGDTAYSVKPSTYDFKKLILPENIEVKMIVYEKSGGKFKIRVDD